MNKIFFLLGIVLSLSTISSYAQPGGGGRGGNSERMLQIYKDSLSLTAAQTDSVKGIMETFQPQQREIFMNQEMSREDKMAAIKGLNQQRNDRLKKVLSDEQMKKLQAMEDRRRQQMMQNGGGGGRFGGQGNKD